jgi:NAD(P)-dependent dehydrogenase (short-subunit alcohol dehydrogenase family)
MNIVVTGASGGIGYQTALFLAKNKANHVYALSRNAEGLAQLQAEVNGMVNGGKLTTFVGDIANDDFLHAVKSKIEATGSSLQSVINNAGLLTYKPFEELTTAEWRAIYEVNVIAPMRVVKVLLPLMKASEKIDATNFRAHIVNIGSIGGVQGSVKFKGLSAYSSSKGALSVMSECMAEEFKDEGIAVNCLALGSVETAMFHSAFPGFEASMQAEKVGAYIGEFAMNGLRYYNGKVLSVSVGTP